ncbi:MAG: hypothetical protein QXX36_01685 [Candidatus Rehaiarchaeum fermentans]|nr:hypothetical protein [Candidatus Rehaiarchaeum fermentans]MCW1297476.1 hypothetical protein [Candidatus Rehaiarchaeum fermentans]MCW1302317.1 hypothetical protein [Candidatus Rehaiarchaeum fermentans]
MERELIREWARFLEESIKTQAYENFEGAIKFIREKAETTEELKLLVEALEAEDEEQILENIRNIKFI